MAQYTQEQMAYLITLSTSVLMATLLVDRNDNIGTMREFRDGIKFITDAKKNYPQNALVQSMMASVDTSIQEVQAYTENQRRAVFKAYQKSIDEVTNLLANDEEAREFKRVLIELAQTVAGAAGFGVFGTGTKVSSAEAKFISALRHRFGMI